MVLYILYRYFYIFFNNSAKKVKMYEQFFLTSANKIAIEKDQGRPVQLFQRTKRANCYFALASCMGKISFFEQPRKHQPLQVIHGTSPVI
jgi:hypothetical protein